MDVETRTVDVRAMASAEQADAVTAAFDGLPAGGGFVLVAGATAGPILERLQAERPGAVEWFLLEAGPAQTRVHVRRRQREGPRGVVEFLEHDHRRLDEKLADVERLSRLGAFRDAAAQFAEFACGLNWHIDAEERVLFPRFEELTGLRAGPTTVMRAEHVQIRRHMASLGAALDAADAAAARESLAQLVAALSDHNMKEEHILYPTTDRLSATARDRDELVQAMQRS